MAKLNIRERLELPDLLHRLNKKSAILTKVANNVPTDIDRKAYAKMCKALHSLNAAMDIILVNQKARGKEFLSDKEVDELIAKVIAETK
jgi:hypothetical protein